MNKEDMNLIINDTILNFKKEINEPVTMFLEKDRFSNYLDIMELKKHLEKTPCFIIEMKGGDIIYYCEEIINNLTKDLSKEKKKEFLEAITIHELFHIWNKIQAKDVNSAIFSEEIVHEELRKSYPKHQKILEEFERKIFKQS